MHILQHSEVFRTTNAVLFFSICKYSFPAERIKNYLTNTELVCLAFFLNFINNKSCNPQKNLIKNFSIVVPILKMRKYNTNRD